MAGRKSKYLGGASSSASDPNRANKLQESSGEQESQQAALSPPPTSRRSHLLGRSGWRSQSSSQLSSPSPKVERCNKAANQLIKTSTSQPLKRQPHTSYSEACIKQTNGPTICDLPQGPQPTATGNITGGGVTVVPSGADSPPSSSAIQCPSFVSASIPIASQNPAPRSVCAPRTPTSALQAQTMATTNAHVTVAVLPEIKSTPVPDITESSPRSAVVWAQALEIAKRKLADNNLPPLDLTKLTSQSAEKNIEAVMKALNTLQEDGKKKRWSYTRRGKKVIIVERLGEILRSGEKYLKIVDIVIQSNQLSTFVWAGVRAIMQVALGHAEAIEGFEIAIAVLLEKVSMCEFYAGIYFALPSQSTAQLQSVLGFALPDLYAAVIVFAVKAHTYFEAKGIKRITNTLKAFEIEFQPYVEEINAKEGVIRECADAATMERVRNIEGVLQDVTLQLKPLAVATHTHKMTKEIHDYVSDDKILELLKMLSPLEPLKRHQDVKLPRTENTGTWLLKLEAFRRWRDSDTVEENYHAFCCYGIPGAGKTVLCSTAIDDLYSHSYKYSNVGVACLYADYNDQRNQTLVHILGSFLCQFLTNAQESIPDEVIQKLHNIRKQRRGVAIEDTLALLNIRIRQFKRAFICIDAIDELESKVRQHLLSKLKELVTNNNTRLFLTGRGHIRYEVQKHFTAMEAYAIDISASPKDIRAFVRQQIKEDDLNPEAMDKLLAKDIEDVVIKKSKGMFLIPTLHIKMVLGMPTISQRRRALRSLPTELFYSFQSIITRIRRYPFASRAKLGIKVLMWLHFAYRPLKLEELQHALAVRSSDTEFDKDNVPSEKVLLDCCLGLVVVDKETSTVRFMHYTLEEYFLDNTTEEFPNGCSSIAKTCLTYLNFGQLRPHCTSLDNLREVLKKYPFLNYAALYWGTYVKQCDHGLMELAKKIVDHKTKGPPCAIQALYFGLDKIWPPFAQKFSGVHATAYFGLSEYMEYFCNIDKHVIDLEDDSNRTPLSWAADYGHASIVQMLIERKDVDINSKDKYGWTPLSLAAMNGHEVVVRLLIGRGDVNVNVKDDYGWTPLFIAVMNGHEPVARLLIERKDVDVNIQDNDRRTPLLLASEKGYKAVVRLLIERGDVDVNVEDNRLQTPLSIAAKNGYEAIVRLLERAGGTIDLDVQDGYKYTPHYLRCQLLANTGEPISYAEICGRTDFYHSDQISLSTTELIIPRFLLSDHSSLLSE